MRSVLIFGATFLSAATLVSAQQNSASLKSPKAVVQEFWQVETHGGSLTPEAARKLSNTFFIRPAVVNMSVLHIILNTTVGTIDESAKTDNWAEVYAGTIELGQVDSALRYKQSQGRASSGPVYGGTLIKFDLVLTDKHWELTPDGITGPELVGSPDWRIVSIADNSPWVTVETAIRYIMEKRDIASDLAVKKNADRTLVKLKGMQ